MYFLQIIFQNFNMDKYVIRESRQGGEHTTSMQSMQFRMNSDNSHMINAELYENYRGFEPEYSNPIYRTDSSGYMINMNLPRMNGLSVPSNNMIPAQNQTRMSGIDPRYLAAFADNNAAYISGQQSMQREQIMVNNAAFTNDFQNRNLIGPNRNSTKTYMQQNLMVSEIPKNRPEYTSNNSKPEILHELQGNNNPQPIERKRTEAKDPKVTNEGEVKISNPGKTRSDKLRTIQKSGPRAFSGPVEKVLKWNKALQDIGILVMYEIVGKCVNVRPGEMCAKNLVVRDENGPAIQVVYYEIDFLLPELKPPCTIRVIGRMMPGTCRLQAFNVRLATGDDVATLPRRAAVASHHVSKICKEFTENLN